MGTGIATGDTITTPTADNQTEQGGYSSFSRLLGTLTIATTSVAVGIGVNWGTGVLTTYGQRYPFAVQGLEVGGVGVSKV
jgi:hypothetical protein